jgi:glutamine cyclotransferase
MIKKLLAFAAAVLFFACNTNTSTSDVDTSIPVPHPNNIPPPKPITFTIDAVYPHDPQAFTQGLEFYKGKL